MRCTISSLHPTVEEVAADLRNQPGEKLAALRSTTAADVVRLARSRGVSISEGRVPHACLGDIYLAAAMEV